MNALCRAAVFGVLAVGPMLALADNEPGEGDDKPLPCYKETWYGTRCSGTCGVDQIWTICPARVLCARSATGGKSTSPIVLGPFECEDWTGGTGTCNGTSRCAGGTRISPPSPSSTTVIIHRQTCPEICP